jgi:hypothetical protein
VRVLLAVFTAIAIALAFTSPCSAQQTMPADAHIYQYPASQVNLTRAYVITFPYWYEPLQGMRNVEVGCVNFVNDGPRTIKRIKFAFVWVNPPPKPMSATSLLTVNGPIAVGGLQNDVRVPPNSGPSFGWPPIVGADCGGVEGNTAWVAEVDYADGTIWKAPVGVPMPAPST